MTSGVKWNEDYTDKDSDVAKYDANCRKTGSILSSLHAQASAATPGEKWVYKTGETHLIGVILTRAIGKPLADYLQKRSGDLRNGAMQ